VVNLVKPAQQIPSDLLDSVRDIAVPVPQLPLGMKIQSVIVTPDGISIRVIGNQVYVAFAKQDAAKHDAQPTAGLGQVAIFDLNGNPLQSSQGGSPNFIVPQGIAVGPDGTAYIADTRLATVLMLKPGSKALEVAAKDPLLAGADGLAFGDKTTLYVNSVTAGKLLRVDLGPDGKSKKVTELKLSRPLDRPDRAQ
jgi:sugar lactone lactonase YvrE